MPIDDVVEAIGAENFAPGSIYRGLDGKAYAVAFTGSSFSTMWIRDDMFKEAGLSKPTNYEELLNAAKTLTVDSNGDGRPDVYGFGIPGGADAATDFRFASFVYQQCGDFYDWDGNVAFDRPEVLEAIKRYLTLFEYSPLGAVGWSWLDGIDAFIGGRIAMHPYGGRLGVNLNRTVPDIREKTSVIPLRTGPVNAGSGGWDYVAIYAKTRYPDVAKNVLGYFLSPDQLQKFSLTVPGHLVPPIKSVKEALLKSDNEYVQKYNSDVATLLDVGSTLVASPSMNMGAIEPGSCTFNPLPNPAPWASEVFSGKPSVISEMFQRITVDKEAPEDAWKWAYTRMGEIADKWKGEHPQWKPIPRS
jgi:multiple sugar transport system substrate-binding protein